jgi:acetolactate decarboxylase
MTVQMNNKTLLFTLLFFLIIAMVPPGDDVISYFSLNHSVRLGQYDGITTVNEVKQHGDFGLGTEEKLATEFVLLDGVAYGIPSDGKVQQLSGETRLAYAVVKKFTADTVFKTSQKFSMSQLKKFLDKTLLKNSFAALCIRGEFSTIECRSFMKEEKPYPPLKHAKERFFNSENLNGTIVGFVTPASAAVINSPVYHFHFVSEKKIMGGHVKKLEMEPGATIEIDYARGIEIKLPSAESTSHIDLHKKSKPEK